MRNTFSTTTVARLLGVAVGSVSNWIDQGKLGAGRTPGGHRRVPKQSLVSFLRRQNLPIPPELVTSRPKVLVVDDEPAVAAQIAEGIRDEHPEVEVLIAHDGFTAGEVCRRIKSHKRTAHTTVIAITAYPSETVRQEILDCGASAYFTKPLDVGAFMAEVSASVGKFV